MTRGMKWVNLKNQRFLYYFTKNQIFTSHLWISLFTCNYVICGLYTKPKTQRKIQRFINIATLFIWEKGWSWSWLLMLTHFMHWSLSIAPEIFWFSDFFLIGIHSKQRWTATTRHGVIRKKSTKRLKHTENLFIKNLQIKGVC